MNKTFCAALGVLAVIGLSGCKLVKTDAGTEVVAAGESGDDVRIAALVTDTWDAKLLPLLNERGTALEILVPAIADGLDAAGAKYGNRGAGGGEAWSFAVKGGGTVVAQNRESRAAKLEIDVNGDGKADAILQLGPVVKGSALRDVAPFYDFSAFRDQIEFAKLARALNDKAVTSFSLPDGDLVGKHLNFTGAMAIRSASEALAVVPVAVEIAP